MDVYDQIKTAFQDIIAPELHALRADIQRLDQKMDSLDARLTTKIDSMEGKLLAQTQRLDNKIDSLKAELIAEIRRLDARIDSVDRELKTAIEIRERLVALEARRPS
jgi:prefoldin subunit 5